MCFLCGKARLEGTGLHVYVPSIIDVTVCHRCERKSIGTLIRKARERWFEKRASSGLGPT